MCPLRVSVGTYTVRISVTGVCWDTRVSVTGACWDIRVPVTGVCWGHKCIYHGCLMTLTGSWVYYTHVRFSLVHTSSSVLHTVRWVLTVLVPLRVVPGATSRDLHP